jgi:fructokinase
MDIRAEIRFPTTASGETLGRAIEFFRQQQAEAPLAAIGIGSFGPLDPRPVSPTYGYITSTPKPGWADTDIVGPIQQALGVPVGFDTDVNVAALGEFRWGAAQGLDTFIYLTVGTGIGGGGMVNGQLVHGLVHPEMGHIHIPHDWQRDPFPGSCPYHGDCFEGLASGPALARRWGQKAETFPAGHAAWSLEAHYLALALINYTCTVSPQRIILGGGVMSQTELYPMVRREFQETLNGYIVSPDIESHIEGYIVPPGLGNRSGVLGAIALAQLVAVA